MRDGHFSPAGIDGVHTCLVLLSCRGYTHVVHLLVYTDTHTTQLLTPLSRACTVHPCSVDLKPGDCELVVDEGRALQPCRYRWCTHMSCIIIYPYSTYPCRGYFHTQ